MAGDECSNTQFGIDLKESLCCGTPGVGLGPFDGGLGHRRCKLRVVKNGAHGVGIVGWFAAFDQIPGFPVIDEADQPADGAGYHRHTARRSFECNEPKALATARHQHYVRRSVPSGKDVVRLRIDELHLIMQTEFVNQRTCFR